MPANTEGRVRSSDLVGNRVSFTLLWGLPTGLVCAGFALPAPANAQLWLACYAVMGLGCVANARNCQRVHCHFTAPWFLSIAALLLLTVTGLLHLPTPITTILAAAGLAGAAIIWLVTEKLWGRYRSCTHTKASNS